MPRRPIRTTLVRRLVDPIATRVRRPIPRIRRTFPPTPMRWSFARLPFSRPSVRSGVRPQRRGT